MNSFENCSGRASAYLTALPHLQALQQDIACLLKQSEVEQAALADIQPLHLQHCCTWLVRLRHHCHLNYDSETSLTQHASSLSAKYVQSLVDSLQ